MMGDTASTWHPPADVPRELLQASNLPAALVAQAEQCEWPDRRPAVKAARLWAGGEMKGLCLIGSVGVGKTCLAATATLARLATCHLPRRAPHGAYPWHDPAAPTWISVALLMVQLRGGWDSDQRAGAQALVASRGAVVFDDLDKVNPTANALEILFAALDTRMQAGASVLITMNLPMGEFSTGWPQPLGQAIASRIAGYCQVVRMGGNDRRL